MVLRHQVLLERLIPAVGLGTTAGVGIGTTISFANPGSGATQAFIPTKSIFIKNHNLNTGDQLTYSPGTGGNGIIVQDETNVGVGTTLSNGQTLFVAKITEDLIGIATVRVGLGLKSRSFLKISGFFVCITIYFSIFTFFCCFPKIFVLPTHWY